MPLIDGVVGDAQQAHLAVTPRLGAGPLDAKIEVAGFPGGKGVNISWRAAAATGIDSHTDIPIRHPFLRIDHLPILVLVGRAFGHIRVLRGHPLPLIGVALLEGKAFGVGAIA
jgi:hypothetical protein